MGGLKIIAVVIGLAGVVIQLDHSRAEAQADRASVEDVQKLVEDMKLNAAVTAMMPQLKQQFSTLLRQMVPDALPGHLEEVETATGKALDNLPSEFVKNVMPLYRLHLTKKEVAAYLKFYATPEGRSIAAKTPLITEQTQKIVGALIEKLMIAAMESAKTQFRSRGYKL